MRLFLTGASGLLGAQVARVSAERGHETVGVVSTWNGPPLAGLARQLQLDLRDRAALDAAIAEAAPDAIVNCAAISDPAACEADPAGTRALNVDLPGWLAAIAQRRGLRLVHVSSEQVFDGSRPPYRSTDPVAPLNVYGKQKVESELAVAAASAGAAATVRSPLLLGNSPSGRRSVHERIFADLMAGRSFWLNTDEIRQPCLARNLAAVLVELCERRDLCGVFHWGGLDAVSRLELATAIARHFGLPTDSIQPSQLHGTPAAAKRPANLTLDLQPLDGLLATRPESLAAQFPQLEVPPAALAWWRERH